MGYWVQVRRSWIQIHFKSEIIISKHETNPNDPDEICCAFHRAGQNANDKKKEKRDWGIKGLGNLGIV